MFFKKKDKDSDRVNSDKKNIPFKKSDSSKNSDPAEELKKPLVDTSFVFFEDK